MFTNIRTSRENKDRVTNLTRKLNLGAENIIARIALTYSLSKERKMDLKNIQNSQGKEYSYKVLFGDYGMYYIAMICVHYVLHKSDRDIAKYVKMHIDDGLELLEKDIENSHNLTGNDFIIHKIEAGLQTVI